MSRVRTLVRSRVRVVAEIILKIFQDFANRGIADDVVELYTFLTESGMPFSVNDIQPTPNPNAAKFLLDREIVDQPTSFFDAGAAKDHPIANRLFAIPGVSSLLLLGDFITVNKTPDAKWSDIKEKVQEALAQI